MPVFKICQLLFWGTQTTKIWPDSKRDQAGEAVKYWHKRWYSQEWGHGWFSWIQSTTGVPVHMYRVKILMSLLQTTSGGLQQLLCFPCHQWPPIILKKIHNSYFIIIIFKTSTWSWLKWCQWVTLKTLQNLGCYLSDHNLSYVFDQTWLKS